MTPNQVTVAALGLSAGAGALIWWRPNDSLPLLLLPVTLFVRMALNALDGMMARELNMRTRMGTFLNELGDVLADAALYLPLAAVPGIDPVLLVVSVILAGVAEMTGVVAVQVGATRRYDGPMGKSDRAFVFGAVALLLGLGVTGGVWLDVVLVSMIVLLAVTIVNRTRKAIAEGAQ